MAEGPSSEKVGYKRPPRARQFKKGQSGNPHGRPRTRSALNVISDSQVDEVLRSELQRQVTVTEGGKPKKYSMLEVVIRAQATSAAKGNPLAQRNVVVQARELELRDADRDRLEAERRSEHFKIMLQWRERRRREWEAVDAIGSEPDNPWPHPDDFMFDHAQQTCRIRGPLYEADVPYYDHIIDLRDFYRLSVELALRRARTKAERDFLCSLYTIAVLHLDAMLPLRWQLGVDSARLGLAVACMPTHKLRSMIKECEEDSAIWEALHPQSPAARHATKRMMDGFKRDVIRKAATQGRHIPWDGW